MRGLSFLLSLGRGRFFLAECDHTSLQFDHEIMHELWRSIPGVWFLQEDIQGEAVSQERVQGMHQQGKRRVGEEQCRVEEAPEPGVGEEQ